MALYLDISQWQDKNMDWAALKKSVDGVILRIGYRGWGSAGTLYVPNDLIASYQSASNWSTILGYTNNQIKKIEGSIYE